VPGPPCGEVAVYVDALAVRPRLRIEVGDERRGRGARHGPIGRAKDNSWNRGEQNLIAANADIGVAKAAYFPRLSLSGLIGGQSTQLSSLFSGPNSAWNFVPQLSQPIFTAGRLRSNVRLAEAQRDSSVVQYEKAIQTAFTEVSNALIAHQRVREGRIKQEALVAVLEERKRLAYMRYQGGVDTQLNALDADRDLLQAQLDLRQIKLNELLSVVQLYKALGGGWQS
jgi:outer membrane protein TolC